MVTTIPPIRNSGRWAISTTLVMLSTACRLTAEAAGARVDREIEEITRSDVHGAVVWVDAPRQSLQRGFARHSFCGTTS